MWCVLSQIVNVSSNIDLCDTVIILLTAVDCDNLTDPSNGQVDHTAGTTFGQTVTYSCETGYNLVGDSTRTCQATGNWSGSAPTCEGVLLTYPVSQAFPPPRF